MGREPTLAIGPFNWAGQARAWTEALQGHTGVPAFSFAGTSRGTRQVTGPPHHRVPHHRLRPFALRNAWLRVALRRVTHVLSEGIVPLIKGGGHDTMSAAEVAWWRERGVRVGGVFHGSDIRRPSRHMERVPDSYFHAFPAAELAALERETAQRRSVAEGLDIPLFVSTPDLVADVPSARWLPLVVDVTSWECEVPALERRVPRVLHLPSQRHPPVKGTSVIDPVLKRLHVAGAIEYVSPQSVPHHEMPALVRSVDVVVDQILTGSYGVAAVESLAAGRLTVGYLVPGVRQVIAEDVPIVDASADDFATSIESVLSDRDAAREIAAAGPGYARRMHDGVRSAAVLAEFVGIT